MADNLPLDYSCPHPSLDDSTPPPLAHVPGNRCSSFVTNRETLNARASILPFLHPLPHSLVLSFALSLSFSLSLSLYDSLVPLKLRFLFPYAERPFSQLFHPFRIQRVLGRRAHGRIYATMRGESRVHANRDTYTPGSCGRVRIYTGNWLRGIHVGGT